MTQHQETILAKIKKLMNLTEARGATPAEAANAAAKITAILFEHNLTMAQAEAHQPDQPREGMGKNEYTVPFGGPMAARWMATLTNIIAKFNFGSVVCDTRSRKIWVIGKPSNVEVILYMSEYIGREIQRLCKAEMHGMNNNSSFYNAFTRGAVSMIHTRLREQEEAMRAKSTTGTELILVSQQALAQAVGEYFPRLRQAKRARSLRDGGAYQQGQAAGKSISITRGIGATKTNRRAIS